MTPFPHLTDTEGVRREAAQQYGGLSDAAAFQQAHRSSLDPNVEAAARRSRNADKTAEVQNDLDLAQAKIDAVHGEGTYRVLDAAVRGDALSTVVEDQYGNSKHVVVGWTDKWRSIVPQGAEAEALANAQSEAAKGRLGAEARAEVQRMVQEATAGIVAKVSELLGGKMDEVQQIRDEEVAKATGDLTDEDRAAINAGNRQGLSSQGIVETRHAPGGGSPSTTEGNDTSETAAGRTQGSETDDGDEAPGKWPRRHDDLDAIAEENGVEFGDEDTTLDAKVAKLEAAGVKPPPEE